jgi:hypothetical protein
MREAKFAGKVQRQPEADEPVTPAKRTPTKSKAKKKTGQ